MKISVVVTISDGAMDRMPETLARLVTAGLVIDQVLRFTGQTTGTCESSKEIDLIRSVPGVLDVTLSREIRLPPPPKNETPHRKGNDFEAQ